MEPILKPRTRKSITPTNEDRVQENSMGDIGGAMDNSSCPESTHRTCNPDGTPMQPVQFSPLDVNYGHENMDLHDITSKPIDGAGELYVDLIVQPETEFTERNGDGNLSTAEDFEVSTRNKCDDDASCLNHFQEPDEGISNYAGIRTSPAPETIPQVSFSCIPMSFH